MSNYERINWTAGTKVKEGYTIINGQEYQTVQPEYSGETPVNVDNLSHMDEGIYEAHEQLIDTGWNDADLTSSAFQLYTSYDLCQYRKKGNVVNIRGAVKPKNQIPAESVTTIFTLPSGYYRTDKGLYAICQGSGMNRWLCEVTTSGEVRCSRYGTTSNSAIGTSAWLPFDIVFLVNQ